MAAAPEVSLITVNYHTAEKIQKLWESLQCSQLTDFEWIIVDNASGDRELSQIKTWAKDPRIRLIPLRENLGFGGGNNEALRWVKSPITVCLNPDIEVQPQTLSQLVDYYRKHQKELGILCPQLYSADGTPQHNTRAWPTWGRLLYRRYGPQRAFQLQEKPTAVPWAQGSFLLLGTDFFRGKLKGFDERFFLFLEDTDLCRRSWEMGKKVVLLPTAVAFHGQERLSGGSWWRTLFRRVFWIHVQSWFRYWRKWYGKKALQTKRS